MGYEFDDNGKYVGWSNLFDYTGIQELQASEYLPIPDGVNYAYKTIQEEKDKLTEQLTKAETEEARKEITNNIQKLQTKYFDISETITNIASIEQELQNLRKTLEDNKTKREQAKKTNDIELLDSLNKEDASIVETIHKLNADKIRTYANVLSKLQDQKKTTVKNKTYTYITWNPNIDEEIANKVLKNLNKHSQTYISPNMLEKCLKNSVSSSITNIIQNLKNMDQAYSPIEMETVRDSSQQSTKGEKSTRMTLMNPLTKFIMQEQNMVGKGVIGITAVGEKVFFNVSHYINEAIRSGNEDWIRNAQFSQTFNRIQGRYSGEIKQVTKNIIANANFDNFEEIRLKFGKYNDVDSALRDKYQITDYDVLNKTGKWKAYSQELLETIRSLQDTDVYADDIISQLLSAATD